MQGNIKNELEMAGFSPDEVADLMIQPEEAYVDAEMVSELREFGGESSVQSYLLEVAA